MEKKLGLCIFPGCEYGCTKNACSLMTILGFFFVPLAFWVLVLIKALNKRKAA